MTSGAKIVLEPAKFAVRPEINQEEKCPIPFEKILYSDFF